MIKQEVKATCGSTPSASITPKPLIGEQRIDFLTSFDWKAHHRETNNLLSIFWDFIAIAACFYRNDLTIDDWGKIVQPKSDGGRTTSVSIMTSSGVKKMCEGWIAVIDSEPYIKAFANSSPISCRKQKSQGRFASIVRYATFATAPSLLSLIPGSHTVPRRRRGQYPQY